MNSTETRYRRYKGLTRFYSSVILNSTETQVQIGTKSHPGIKIKAPKVRVSEWSTSNDLDAVIEQTLSFSIELDATKGKAIEAVLTNTKANYNA